MSRCRWGVLLLALAVPPRAVATEPLDVWALFAECSVPADLRCASVCAGEGCDWACTWTADAAPSFADDCSAWRPLLRHGHQVRMWSEGTAAQSTETWLKTSIPSPGAAGEARLAELVASLPSTRSAIERELDRAGFGGRARCEADACVVPGATTAEPALVAVGARFGWEVSEVSGALRIAARKRESGPASP